MEDKKGNRPWRIPGFRLSRRLALISGVLLVIIASTVFFRLSSVRSATGDPPEAEKILSIQNNLNFGVLIPGYLPDSFDRPGMEIAVNNNGPLGEPKVEIVYRGRESTAVFIQEWLAINPEMTTLSGSRPIQTRWGKGWLLTQSSMTALWLDVGPLRIALSTNNPEEISREELVMAADSLGLASNLQIYSFVNELPVIRDVAPPPPFEVQVNASGFQELNLTITPGGYSPMRFAVQKGIPVKINFRALGEVGCGNTLIFPVDQNNSAAVTLTKEKASGMLEFTPEVAGEFGFHCSSNHYRGIMTVR